VEAAVVLTFHTFASTPVEAFRNVVDGIVDVRRLARLSSISFAKNHIWWLI
jgi:hypothetical protein